MQAEATDSALREGIETLGVKDTETPAEKEDNTEKQGTEMTAVPGEVSTIKEEKGNFIKKTHDKKTEGCIVSADTITFKANKAGNNFIKEY